MRDTDFMIKQGWMVTRLHLNGTALDIYALVYGYTKDGASWYETQKANICEWLGVTERCIQSHISALVKAGYIIRREDKYGRGSKLALMANPEIIDAAEKGENFSPLKREKKTTEKGENFSEKGEKNDITPYIKILIKDEIRIILLRAPAREEEEKEFFKIFFFRSAADPAAEVANFVRYNEANRADWETLPAAKKYYFATSWKVEAERPVKLPWLKKWSLVYNWAAEHDPAFSAQLLDIRFNGYFLHDAGETYYEFRVTAAVKDWLLDHKEDVCVPYLKEMARGAKVMWSIPKEGKVR